MEVVAREEVVVDKDKIEVVIEGQGTEVVALKCNPWGRTSSTIAKYLQLFKLPDLPIHTVLEKPTKKLIYTKIDLVMHVIKDVHFITQN